MSMPGFVYALINPSISGLVKVGQTTRDPTSRAAELSAATGVPTPFIVVYDEYFDDCVAAESYVHALLEHSGFRLSSNREFFNATVSDVVKAISSAPGRTSPTVAPNDDGDPLLCSVADELSELRLQNYDFQSPVHMLMLDAMKSYSGSGETIQDFGEAIRLARQAAKLGSADAYILLGMCHRGGDGSRPNPAKVIEYYKEAARKGCTVGYAELAQAFLAEGYPENASKAWNMFFSALAKKKPRAAFEWFSTPKAIVDFLFHKAIYKPSLESMSSDVEVLQFLPAMEPFSEEIRQEANEFIRFFEDKPGWHVTTELLIAWIHNNLS